MPLDMEERENLSLDGDAPESGADEAAPRNSHAGARRRPPGWLWALVALVLAAIIGTAIGISLGSRQGGPLAAQPGTGGRPTIVVATAPAVAPSASPGPSPSPSVAPSAVVAQQGSTTYVVQPGDTLRNIAQSQYGDATQWPRIYDANRDVIGPDPDSLNAGETLQIPH
jgi:LysM repeat protein